MKYADYREKRQHGSADFPLQYYYVDKLHPQYVMPLHWHREMELLRVISGELTLYINNEVFELCSGDAVIIPSGALHRGEPRECAYDCAVFDLSMIASSKSGRARELTQLLMSSGFDISPICPSAEESIGELLDTVARGEEYYELRVLSLLSGIAHEVYLANPPSGEHRESEKNARRRAVITLLINKIEKEYMTRLTLSDLAELAQVNEKYLCRFFKEYTGQTPIDYINRLRVDRACYEMSVTGMNVTEAAFECGFNELSYFSKMFKKYKGIAPGEYRKRYCKRGNVARV